MSWYRVGVDIGGTFTDLVFLGTGGEVLAMKVASTPADYSLAVLEGIQEGIRQLGAAPGAITEVSHGFTIATNAILEEKGARTALITTAGFRDVLEFRRNRVPRLYDLHYRKPAALVKRQLRFEVRERMNARGEVVVPLDPASVEAMIVKLVDAKVESVVICLLHSYANADHEQRVATTVRQRCPKLTLTLSSELLPIIKEYERTSTAVINGYVRPVVERYLNRLADGLKRAGVDVPLSVMQSNGGLTTPQIAAERPAFCIESGPAAGVMGAAHMGQRVGLADLMTLDMGGTTAKASIIENGEVLQSKEYEVGAGLNAGHRLLRGAGHILSVPAIDIAEVGAGGGSIARVDGSRSLRVGPDSSGAVPGPACYGRGGTRATVTDANVLLGFLNPDYLLGGSFALSLDKARAAIQRDVAEPLGLSEVEAAYGIHLLANSNMSRALKAVSTERGRDPRRFTLMTFGGGGPVHATGLADMLGIARLIIPPYPGVFSAFGLLFSAVEHHIVRTYFKPFLGLDLAAFNGIIKGMRDEARQVLRAELFSDDRQHIAVQLDVKHEGQGSELMVPLPDGAVIPETMAAIARAFDAEHTRTFGHHSDAPHQLVNIRVIARGISETSRVPKRLVAVSTGQRRATERRAYFGPKHQWATAKVMQRTDLGKTPTAGPLLVEEYDSTCVVPPGWRVSIDELQNLILETAR
ncbi:MAG: hydantoinase/oxoprolinase family protein [Planctomycetes bacterium]|nr:hydantoinase/oxoprolinase family protein [Planctomycetota bacterium]